MQVRDIMSRDVECIKADCSVQEAAQKMKSHDIGPLPVIDNNTLGRNDHGSRHCPARGRGRMRFKERKSSKRHDP